MVNLIKLLMPPLFIIIYQKTKRYLQNLSIHRLPTGYENLLLINTVIEKSITAKNKMESQKLINMDSFRIFVAMALGNGEINRVIDLGGASGYHFFSAMLLPNSRNFEWVVVETPLFSEEAKKREELKEIIFCDNIYEAFSALENDVDLVYCSRALQYIDDPIRVLREICAANPKYIFITGIAFSPDDEIHLYSQRSELQNNGPQVNQRKLQKLEQVEYPLQLFPRKKIEEILTENYSIELRIDEDSQVHLFEGKKIGYNGLWAVRRDIV